MGVLDRFRLDGKVALVTGGTKGLGLAMAGALASAGASVALTGRDEASAGAVAKTLGEEEGARTLGIGADVATASEVEAMVARTLDEFGRIDILVNNAGINIRRPIEQLEEAEFDRVLDINLKGPWLCCRAVAPIMKRQKWGRVINVSSTLGEVGLADRTPYCSSKGGLTLMTRTLALEWARDGINGSTPSAPAPSPPRSTDPSSTTPSPGTPCRPRSPSAAGETPPSSVPSPSSSPPKPPASSPER